MRGFVLYLELHRFFADEEPGAEQSWKNRTWAFTGFASRLASATLSDSGRTPFENEMRKRLQLALWYLEHRAREDLGRNTSPWNSSDSNLAIFPSDLSPKQRTGLCSPLAYDLATDAATKMDGDFLCVDANGDRDGNPHGSDAGTNSGT
jgi:hypothetical protein